MGALGAVGAVGVVGVVGVVGIVGIVGVVGFARCPLYPQTHQKNIRFGVASPSGPGTSVP